MEKWFILDIDGTLADGTHRQWLIEGPRKNWTRFFEEGANDSVYPECMKCVKHLVAAGYKFAIITGRPEKLKSMTTAWLEKNLAEMMAVCTGVHFRPNGDFRKGPEFKKEVLETMLKNGKASGMPLPEFSFENDGPCKDMFTEQGIPGKNVEELSAELFPRATLSI